MTETHLLWFKAKSSWRCTSDSNSATTTTYIIKEPWYNLITLIKAINSCCWHLNPACGWSLHQNNTTSHTTQSQKNTQEDIKIAQQFKLSSSGLTWEWQPIRRIKLTRHRKPLTKNNEQISTVNKLSNQSKHSYNYLIWLNGALGLV